MTAELMQRFEKALADKMLVRNSVFAIVVEPFYDNIMRLGEVAQEVESVLSAPHIDFLILAMEQNFRRDYKRALKWLKREAKRARKCEAPALLVETILAPAAAAPVSAEIALMESKAVQ